MELHQKIVPVELPDGSLFRVQATAITPIGEATQLAPGEEIESDVSIRIPSFQEVTNAIESISESIKGAVDKVKPTKACVEFGLEFGYELGQLVAIIAQGDAKVNLKISLEWEQK